MEAKHGKKVVTTGRTVNRFRGAPVLPCYTAHMMRKVVATIAVSACATLPAACGRAPSDDPDLLLTGGVIYPLGSTEESVEALAIRGSTVLAIGTDAEIFQLAGTYTQQMALGDSVVLPGAYDAWIDIEALGRWSTGSLDLRRASSVDEVHAMVRNAAGEPTATEGWLVGWGWDENDWPEAVLPDHTDLDVIGLERPIALLHRSGLMAWVNGAALAALTESSAGVDRDGGSGRASPAPRGILTGDAYGRLTDLLAGENPTRSGAC